MISIDGVVINVGNLVHIETGHGEIVLNDDDWRIADKGGLKPGDCITTRNVGMFPKEDGDVQTIFYIGEFTSVWVNGVELPIRPEVS